MVGQGTPRTPILTWLHPRRSHVQTSPILRSQMGKNGGGHHSTQYWGNDVSGAHRAAWRGPSKQEEAEARLERRGG